MMVMTREREKEIFSCENQYAIFTRLKINISTIAELWTSAKNTHRFWVGEKAFVENIGNYSTFFLTRLLKSSLSHFVIVVVARIIIACWLTRFCFAFTLKALQTIALLMLLILRFYINIYVHLRFGCAREQKLEMSKAARKKVSFFPRKKKYNTGMAQEKNDSFVGGFEKISLLFFSQQKKSFLASRNNLLSQRKILNAQLALIKIPLRSGVNHRK